MKFVGGSNSLPLQIMVRKLFHFTIITLLHQMDSSYYSSLNLSISNSRVSGQFLLLLCFIEIPVFNANNADPIRS